MRFLTLVTQLLPVLALGGLVSGEDIPEETLHPSYIDEVYGLRENLSANDHPNPGHSVVDSSETQSANVPSVPTTTSYPVDEDRLDSNVQDENFIVTNKRTERRNFSGVTTKQSSEATDGSILYETKETTENNDETTEFFPATLTSSNVTQKQEKQADLKTTIMVDDPAPQGQEHFVSDDEALAPSSTLRLNDEPEFGTEEMNGDVQSTIGPIIEPISNVESSVKSNSVSSTDEASAHEESIDNQNLKSNEAVQSDSELLGETFSKPTYTGTGRRTDENRLDSNVQNENFIATNKRTERRNFSGVTTKQSSEDADGSSLYETKETTENNDETTEFFPATLAPSNVTQKQEKQAYLKTTIMVDDPAPQGQEHFVSDDEALAPSSTLRLNDEPEFGTEEMNGDVQSTIGPIIEPISNIESSVKSNSVSSTDEASAYEESIDNQNLKSNEAVQSDSELLGETFSKPTYTGTGRRTDEDRLDSNVQDENFIAINKRTERRNFSGVTTKQSSEDADGSILYETKETTENNDETTEFFPATLTPSNVTQKQEKQADLKTTIMVDDPAPQGQEHFVSDDEALAPSSTLRLNDEPEFGTEEMNGDVQSTIGPIIEPISNIESSVKSNSVSNTDEASAYEESIDNQNLKSNEAVQSDSELLGETFSKPTYTGTGRRTDEDRLDSNVQDENFIAINKRTERRNFSGVTTKQSSEDADGSSLYETKETTENNDETTEFFPATLTPSNVTQKQEKQSDLKTTIMVDDPAPQGQEHFVSDDEALAPSSTLRLNDEPEFGTEEMNGDVQSTIGPIVEPISNIESSVKSNSVSSTDEASAYEESIDNQNLKSNEAVQSDSELLEETFSKPTDTGTGRRMNVGAEFNSPRDQYSEILNDGYTADDGKLGGESPGRRAKNSSGKTSEDWLSVLKSILLSQKERLDVNEKMLQSMQDTVSNFNVNHNIMNNSPNLPCSNSAPSASSVPYPHPHWMSSPIPVPQLPTRMPIETDLTEEYADFENEPQSRYVEYADIEDRNLHSSDQFVDPLVGWGVQRVGTQYAPIIHSRGNIIIHGQSHLITLTHRCRKVLVRSKPTCKRGSPVCHTPWNGSKPICRPGRMECSEYPQRRLKVKLLCNEIWKPIPWSRIIYPGRYFDTSDYELFDKRIGSLDESDRDLLVSESDECGHGILELEISPNTAPLEQVLKPFSEVEDVVPKEQEDSAVFEQVFEEAIRKVISEAPEILPPEPIGDLESEIVQELDPSAPVPSTKETAVKFVKPLQVVDQSKKTNDEIEKLYDAEPEILSTAVTGKETRPHDGPEMMNYSPTGDVNHNVNTNVNLNQNINSNGNIDARQPVLPDVQVPIVSRPVIKPLFYPESGTANLNRNTNVNMNVNVNQNHNHNVKNNQRLPTQPIAEPESEKMRKTPQGGQTIPIISPVIKTPFHPESGTPNLNRNTNVNMNVNVNQNHNHNVNNNQRLPTQPIEEPESEKIRKTPQGGQTIPIISPVIKTPFYPESGTPNLNRNTNVNMNVNINQNHNHNVNQGLPVQPTIEEPKSGTVRTPQDKRTMPEFEYDVPLKTADDITDVNDNVNSNINSNINLNQNHNVNDEIEKPHQPKIEVVPAVNIIPKVQQPTVFQLFPKSMLEPAAKNVQQNVDAEVDSNFNSNINVNHNNNVNGNVQKPKTSGGKDPEDIVVNRNPIVLPDIVLPSMEQEKQDGNVNANLNLNVNSNNNRNIKENGEPAMSKIVSNVPIVIPESVQVAESPVEVSAPVYEVPLLPALPSSLNFNSNVNHNLNSDVNLNIINEKNKNVIQQPSTTPINQPTPTPTSSQATPKRISVPEVADSKDTTIHTNQNVNRNTNSNLNINSNQNINQDTTDQGTHMIPDIVPVVPELVPTRMAVNVPVIDDNANRDSNINHNINRNVNINSNYNPAVNAPGTTNPGAGVPVLSPELRPVAILPEFTLPEVVPVAPVSSQVSQDHNVNSNINVNFNSNINHDVNHKIAVPSEQPVSPVIKPVESQPVAVPKHSEITLLTPVQIDVIPSSNANANVNNNVNVNSNVNANHDVERNADYDTNGKETRELPKIVKESAMTPTLINRVVTQAARLEASGDNNTPIPEKVNILRPELSKNQDLYANLNHNSNVNVNQNSNSNQNNNIGSQGISLLPIPEPTPVFIHEPILLPLQDQVSISPHAPMVEPEILQSANSNANFIANVNVNHNLNSNVNFNQNNQIKGKEPILSPPLTPLPSSHDPAGPNLIHNAQPRISPHAPMVEHEISHSANSNANYNANVNVNHNSNSNANFNLNNQNRGQEPILLPALAPLLSIQEPILQPQIVPGAGPNLLYKSRLNSNQNSNTNVNHNVNFNQNHNIASREPSAFPVTHEYLNENEYPPIFKPDVREPAMISASTPVQKTASEPEVTRNSQVNDNHNANVNMNNNSNYNSAGNDNGKGVANENENVKLPLTKPGENVLAPVIVPQSVDRGMGRWNLQTNSNVNANYNSNINYNTNVDANSNYNSSFGQSGLGTLTPGTGGTYENRPGIQSPIFTEKSAPSAPMLPNTITGASANPAQHGHDAQQNINTNANYNSNSNYNSNYNTNYDHDSNHNSQLMNHQTNPTTRGWYELWYNNGEDSDGWAEIWNNKQFKKFLQQQLKDIKQQEDIQAETLAVSR